MNRVRCIEALRLRQAGLTYREIGEKLGVCRQRAYVLVEIGERLEARDV